MWFGSPYAPSGAVTAARNGTRVVTRVRSFNPHSSRLLPTRAHARHVRARHARTARAHGKRVPPQCAHPTCARHTPREVRTARRGVGVRCGRAAWARGVGVRRGRA
eukprot:3821994-Prymnesium_polylepis.1